jgi:hypothetical protein
MREHIYYELGNENRDTHHCNPLIITITIITTITLTITLIITSNIDSSSSTGINSVYPPLHRGSTLWCL